MPGVLRLAVILTAVQALALVGYCVAIAIAAQDSRGSSVTATGMEIVMYLVFAALIGLLSWALARRKPLARTPYLVTEVFVVIVGYTVFVGDGTATKAVGAALLVVGFVGAVSAFSPTLVAALHSDEAN